jgi:phasin family protein
MAAPTKDLKAQNLAALESAKESARHIAETARQAADTTQETLRAAAETASQTLQRAADELGRTLGLSGEQGQELARQSTRNLEAMTECGTVLARGFQEISREWITLAQHRLQRNLEALETLASCRTMQDLVAAQTQLVRDNMQEIVDTGRHIAEASVKVANEAAEVLTTPAQAPASRLHRAA